MKNKLKRNLGLKLAAILLATVLWMINMDLNDPVDKRMLFGVKVQIVNADLLTSQGMTYKVLNNSDNVTVTFQGKTSLLSQISEEDITLKADIARMNSENTIPIEWLVEDSVVNRLQGVSLSKENVYLSLEKVDTRQLRIEVAESGKLPAGYVTGTISTATNTFSISGPESAIAPVKRAVVDINLDNATTNINMEAAIRLLDAEGKEINNPEIRKTIDSVSVNVPVLLTKEVPIVFESMGMPEEGYAATGVMSISQPTVLIAARESVLNNVAEIRIPASALNIDGLKESLVQNVDIRKYLPSEVVLAERTESGIVSVTVEIEAIRHKVLTFSGNDIQLLNNPDTQKWLIEAVPNQYLRLRLAGLTRYLDAVDLSVVVPHIDLSVLEEDNGELIPGEVDVNILFLVPEELVQEENVKVRLRVTQINTEAVAQQ